MMSDMEGLSKAEQTLLELQEKLHERDTELKTLSEENKFSHGRINDFNPEEDTPLMESERMELDRVKQEVEALRNELHRAEVELEDKCWMAPPVLQHWLQVPNKNLKSSIFLISIFIKLCFINFACSLMFLFFISNQSHPAYL